MIYGAKQKITVEEYDHHIKDIEPHIKEALYCEIARRASSDSFEPIKKTKDNYGQYYDFELKAHLFSENEFNKFMGDILGAIYDPAVEIKVRKIIASQGASPTKAGKKYI